MTPHPRLPPPTAGPRSSTRAFMIYWLSRLAASFAVQIQTVAVGWQVYDLTRDPLDLGLVGLSQFLPALLLVLVTGAVADRFRRRTIMAVCLAIEALCAVALLAFTLIGIESVVADLRRPRRLRHGARLLRPGAAIAAAEPRADRRCSAAPSR